MEYKKIYFFDFGAFNPHRTSNVLFRANEVKKENKVLFKEEQKWEVRYDNCYPNVFYDPKYKIYRCYYSTFTSDKGSSDFSLEQRKGRDYKVLDDRIVSLCYAYSEDGVNWIKPNLNMVEFDGNKDNNIIGSFLHGTSVFYDEQETDSSKKYKMFTKIDLGNSKDHYMAVRFSSDGLHFGEPIKTPNFNPRGDTHNVVYYDENINKYVLISRAWRDSIRVPVIAYSDDFIHWSSPKEALASRGYGAQIYSMPIFKRGDYTIGLASMYHEGDMLDENYDTVDVELTYCYNHTYFNYVSPDLHFIPTSGGEYGESFDCGCIYTSTPVVIGDRAYFYYLGSNGKHNGFREGSLARAYIENDRWAYATNKRKDVEAFLYTNSFNFDKSVQLDMDISKEGYVIVELYDGVTHEKLNENATVQKVNNNYLLSVKDEFLGRDIRLGIRFKNAKIYSIEGEFELKRIENETSLFRG